MTSAILIELPSQVKQELERLCNGLPSVEWHSPENLYISLRIFEKLTDAERWDLMDQLGEIEIHPFVLKIHHLQFQAKRGNSGTLWAVLESSKELDFLKKSIDHQLRSFNPHIHENDSLVSPAIRLGIAQRESPERLAAYFEANGDYKSAPFNVTEYVWAQLYQTPKNSFYKVEKRYFLT